MPRGYALEDRIAFIKETYADALTVSRKSGFPIVFILAQAAYETGWGEKVIPGSYNLFNIKADRSWKGPKKKALTTEFMKMGDGSASPIKVRDEFRAYGSYAESMDDWFDFLRTNPRYHGIGVDSEGRQFVDIFDPVIKGDPATLAYALWHDGFATDPDYAETLVSVMKGPTMKKALRRIEEDGAAETFTPSISHTPSGGKTLRRDTSDYRKVWRIEEDGSTRGYFICND
ncbi:MAG: glucosaminidase domain-containing protein [Deltaproteobacteria bacterium]|nr:glucosaminidase domain-containing protein [Deltaproteobacteria bacterium]